jgi:MFS family permease
VTKTESNGEGSHDRVPPVSAPRRRLSKTVVALGFVSLFTDIASEMVYTQVPIFLTLVMGVRADVIGIIEGVAESTASLLRVVAGGLSDFSGRRKPLTIAGYGFGAIAKPLLYLATGWPMVLALRFLDRVGKGLRTAPRDALIADETPPELRGRAFGLHRAMDTTGAVLGPLLGLWFLSLFVASTEVKLRSLFLFAGIPGLLAVVTLIVFVRERRAEDSSHAKTQKRKEEGGEGTPSEVPGASVGPGVSSKLSQPPTPAPAGDRNRPNSLVQQWRELDPGYRRFLWITLLFNLGNSSDAFLILRANHLGFDSQMLLWLYAAFNVVEAALGYAAGILSDRVGRRPLIVAGYAIFALVYLGFALVNGKSHLAIWALFLLYGGYYTLTQGSQRAFAADFADPAKRGAQIGAYHTVVGLSLLPASIIAGRLYLWNQSAPFCLSAITAAVSAVLLAGQPNHPMATSRPSSEDL